MGDRLQIYGGKKANIPLLLSRELGYCTDEMELYIGDGKKNILIASAKVLSDMQNMSEKLTASPAQHIVSLSTDASLSAVVTTINQLLTNMIEAGLMHKPR